MRDRRGHPRLGALEDVDPIGRRAPGGALRQRLAGHGLGWPWARPRTRSPSRAARPAPPSRPLVALLPRAFCRVSLARRCPDAFVARKALRALRTDLVEADYDAVLGCRGIELVDDPRFLANSGSTRSPNQVSGLRHRTPSARSTASRRVRFTGCLSARPGRRPGGPASTPRTAARARRAWSTRRRSPRPPARASRLAFAPPAAGPRARRGPGR